MRIDTVEIKNFRSIKEETVQCTGYNSFVGPNGSGKSTVLNALNIFFGEITVFTDGDFFGRETKAPISVKVTFSDLSEHATEEFSHYVRNEKLIVSVEVNKDVNGGFKKSVHGERLIFAPFKGFFEATSATDRGKIFTELRKTYPEIEAATNDTNRKSAFLFHWGIFNRGIIDL